MIAALAAAAAAGGVATFGAVAPNSRLYGPVIGRGPRAEKRVYLTFDDGPNPAWTPAILSLLQRHDVPAAFFTVGKYVAAEPEIARDVVAAGHLLGNHTWSHRKLHLKSPAYIRNELQRTHAILCDVTGQSPLAFRAPHGYRNPFVSPNARALGYTTFGWTYGVWDTALPGVQRIRERMRHGLRNGAILLLHDGDGYDADGDRSQTVAALPWIIDDVRARGYEFRPLSELLPV